MEDDVLKFKISIDGTGFQQFENESRATFSRVESAARETNSRMQSAERQYSEFFGAESARRRLIAIQNYNDQLAAQARSNQAMLDETRRLQQQQTDIEAQAAAKRRQNAIENYNAQTQSYIANLQRQADESRRIQQSEINQAAQAAADKRNRSVNGYFQQAGLSNNPDLINETTRKQAEQQRKTYEYAASQIREGQDKLNEVLNRPPGGGDGGGGGSSSGGGGRSFFGKGGFFGFLLDSAVFSLVHRVIYGLINDIQQLAQAVVNAGISAVKMAGDYQATINALSTTTGSARLAAKEIENVDNVARNTTGLGFEEAEKGYTRLRNLGFAAQTSLNLIQGLAKFKLISNSDENAINRVIVNLTQLAAGSPRASQDIRETIQQIPKLKEAFQDAFGTTNAGQIGNIFKQNPDDAINKLADAMSKAKQPAGGLNSALVSLNNEVIATGREFGKPILDPLTFALEQTTKLLYNSRDLIKEWGQDMASLVASTGLFIAGLNGLPPRNPYKDKPEAQPSLAQILGGAIGQATGLPIIGAVATGGTALSVGQEQDFNAEEQKAIDQAKADAAEKLRKFNENVERQNTLQNLKSTKAAELAVIKDKYTQEEALLNSHINLNKQAELDDARRARELKRQSSDAEIRDTVALYDQLMQAAQGDQATKDKLRTEETQKLSALYTQQYVNDLEAQKRITQLELDAERERRDALIESKKQTISFIKAIADSQQFDLSRAIDRGNATASDGYGQLRQIAVDSYTQIRQATLEQYDLQLQDERLTNEQKANLQFERNAAELQLAEDHRQKLLQLDDQYYAKTVEDLKRNIEELSDVRNSSADLFGSLGALFDPSNFSARRGRAVGGVLDSMRENLITQLKGAASDENSAQDALKLLDPASADPKAYAEAVEKANDASENRVKITRELIALSKSVPSKLFDFIDLGDSLAKGAEGIESFDRAAKTLLDIKHQFETADLESQIGLITDLLDLAKKSGNKSDELTLTHKLESLSNERITLGIKQQAESVDQYSNSLAGLNETIAKLENRDAAELLGAKYESDKAVANERVNLLKENIDLENRYAHIGEDAAARYRNAWLKAITDIREASVTAKEEQITAQVQIANQTVFNADVAKAGILKAVAAEKGYTEIFEDAFLGVSDAISGGIGKVLDKATAGLGAFGKVIADIGTSLIKMVTNRLMIRLLDAILPATSSGGGFGIGTVGSTGGAGGGGILGSAIGILTGGAGNANAGGLPAGLAQAIIGQTGLLGTGNIASLGSLGGLFSNSGVIPNLNPSSITSDQLLSSSVGNGISDTIGLIGGGTYKAASGGLGGFGGLLSGLGGAAPLLGLSLGMGLGQGSAGGSILGGIGGLLGGVAGAGLLGALGFGGSALFGTTLATSGGLTLGGGIGGIFGAGGILGGVGSVFSGIGGAFGLTGAAATALGSTVVLAPIAAALLIGSWLIGRNSLRKKEEKIRTQYINDSLGQLDTILKDVRAHKYSNAEDAINAANAVRDQYQQQASTLKDKKTRNIALKEINDRINPKIAEITAAAKQVDIDRKYFEDLIPEFATGGIVPGQIGAPRLVLAHGGEIIANLGQQTPDFLTAAADAGVPGLAGRGGGSRGAGGNIHVELHVGRKMQNELFVNGAKSSAGFTVLGQQRQKDDAYEQRSTSLSF